MSEAGHTLTVALRTNKRYFSKVYDDRPFLLHEPLFRWGARKKGWLHRPAALADLEPRLVEWYEVSPDASVYTLHLRHGVKSINGNELTSADVRWSWERIFQLRGVGRFTGRIAPMKSQDNIIEKDKYTVEFRLDKPNITFPHFLASKYIPIVDSTEVKKHITADDPWAAKWLQEHHAAFGPFYVEKYDEKADIVIYGAHQNYWAGAPLPNRLILRGVPNASDRVRLLKNGEVDIALSLSAEDFMTLQNNPNLNMTIVPSHDPMMLQMNCQKEPFKSVKVRQAVSYAVPYQELMDSIWKVASRPYRSPFIDVCLGYTDEFFHYKTDLIQAKALMAEAGIKSAINADMYVCGEILPEIIPTAKAIQTALAKIGINITIKDVNEQDFRTVSFAHSFDLMLDPHTHQVADGYYVSYDDYGDERWGIENMNQYFEPEVFKLQEESLKAKSEAERIQYIRDLQRVILEGAPQAYLFQINSLTGAQTSVRGMEWDLNGRMFYQHVYKA
jgi:peptide/nickel transport system substrate-binding protein